MTDFAIPFNRPYSTGREQDYIAQVIASGHASGDGQFTKKCQTWLERTCGAAKALLTTSCTHALEMAAILADAGPGDEVILPAFTFVSTANAFVLRGAKPVFADIRPDTLNIDERLLPGLITPRTKAICVVHYAGVGCRMETIKALADEHGLMVIEDNAHGLMGAYQGKPLGSFGRLATLSFHETKNFTCGEGGALIINDPDLVLRAEIIREKGTNRSQFFQGMVDKYGWMDIGSSYLPSDILAAFLWAQFEAATDIQARRQRIWEFYDQHLAEWAETNGVARPQVPEDCMQSFHMYYLLMPSQDKRRELIAYLKERGILAVFHYLPLNASPMGQKLGSAPNSCPVTKDVSERLVRLPFYNDLTEGQQTEVVEAVKSFRF